MSRRILWVVEMLVDGRWEPTVGVQLGREPGREELKDWQERNPPDKFRLVKYAPYGRDTTSSESPHKEK